MPCGGIFPSGESAKEYKNNNCWHCGKVDPLPDHFLVEWDAFIHGTCVKAYLATDEGQIVLNHKHEIVVKLPGEEEKTWVKEGDTWPGEATTSPSGP